MNVLRALQAEGYDTGMLPVDGQALIERLAAGPTNDLSDRARRPGGELYALAAYRRFFAGLPQAVQAAVIARWGDRKSVVWGTSVSVRVDPGWCRVHKKK